MMDAGVAVGRAREKHGATAVQAGPGRRPGPAESQEEGRLRF